MTSCGKFACPCRSHLLCVFFRLRHAESLRLIFRQSALICVVLLHVTCLVSCSKLVVHRACTVTLHALLVNDILRAVFVAVSLRVTTSGFVLQWSSVVSYSELVAQTASDSLFSPCSLQANITRGYIHSVRQGETSLPDGPVIMSPDRLITSFKREVIDRKPQVRVCSFVFVFGCFSVFCVLTRVCMSRSSKLWRCATFAIYGPSTTTLSMRDSETETR